MDKLKAMTLLVSTAETHGFSETGRRFGMSTASVSRRISELEEHLGVVLLHRSTRNLVLTEAGQAYVREAEEILAAVSRAEAGVIALQDSPNGLLRVHSRTMFGLSLLAPLQAEFAEKYRDLTVELHLSERPARLREDGFDVDFRIAPPQESGLMRKRMFQSERILVASPDYLDEAPPIRRPRDLAEHRCLVYWLGADPPYWRFRKNQRVEELGIPSNFFSNNGQALLEAARGGHGLALLDDYTVAGDIRSGRLRRVLSDYQVTNTTFEGGVFATFLETSQMPAKLRVYLDFISDSLPRHMGRVP